MNNDYEDLTPNDFDTLNHSTNSNEVSKGEPSTSPPEIYPIVNEGNPSTTPPETN
jgi:hypothetical protein